MEEEVIVLSPDRLGYKDRGKMKWQGLMLSDHNAALKQMKEGHYYPDVKCMVKGYSRDNIYLQLKDGQMKKVSIYLIGNVEYMNLAEWYVKSRSM